jgi:uncharacterized protein (TIGR04255 family)
MTMDAVTPKTPNFAHPPLTEVVCGVQFAPVEGWLTGHCGLFWKRIKDEYPGSEDQPPLGRLKVEEFEPPDELNLTVLPPLRRVFFSTEPANYLIQLQSNRFLHNWRKLLDSDDYPKFPDAYSRFTQRWSDFNSFLAESALPVPVPQVYELTYVNMITAPDTKFPRDVWRFMNFYKGLPKTASGADPRSLELNMTWPLPDDAGRLVMKVKHGVRATEPRDKAEPVLVVEFSTIGASAKAGTSMEQWFKDSHDTIVYTFDALTTETSHKMWGKFS